MREAVLAFVEIERGRGELADLSGAHLSSADLRGAVFSGAHLSEAILSKADFSGAGLRGAILTPEQLADTCGDADTRLPEGFETSDAWPCRIILTPYKIG